MCNEIDFQNQKKKEDAFKDKAMFIAHELHKKRWSFIVNVII